MQHCNTCRGYNGWSNQATWCVNLWLNNDESSYLYAQELVQRRSRAHEAAELLREYVEQSSPLGQGASMYSDLLQAALESVNWCEIAEAFQE